MSFQGQGGGPKPKYSEEEIRQAFIKHNGNISQVIKDLRCSPRTIYYRLGRSDKLRETLDQCRGSVYLRSFQVKVDHLDHEDPKIQEKASTYFMKVLGRKYGWTEDASHRERQDKSVREFLGIE